MNPNNLRSLAWILRAERACEAATAEALHGWTKAYLSLIIDGATPSVRTPSALVAAVSPDPSKSEQARPLWNALVASLVLPKLRDLWNSRLSLSWPQSSARMSEAFERRATDFINRAPDRIMGRANAIVEDGVKMGLSPEQIADDLRAELPDMVPTIAKRTGRFLGGDIYNDAVISGARAAEGRFLKSWTSMHDLRVRETHMAADSDPANTKIPLDKQFHVGGSFADHPRDPALPLEEVMGCRCWVSVERA